MYLESHRVGAGDTHLYCVALKQSAIRMKSFLKLTPMLNETHLALQTYLKQRIIDANLD